MGDSVIKVYEIPIYAKAKNEANIMTWRRSNARFMKLTVQLSWQDQEIQIWGARPRSINLAGDFVINIFYILHTYM